MACLYAANPEYVKGKYKLPMLREVENLVAEAVEVNVPFMNPITCVYLHRYQLLITTDRFSIRIQWLLRLYPQGWYPRKSHLEQSEHVRNFEAGGLWADEIRLDWVSCWFTGDPPRDRNTDISLL